MDWLGQYLKLMALTARVLQQVCGLSLAGEEKDLASGQEAANLDGCINAGHIRHHYVSYHQVRSLGAGPGNGFSAAIHRARVKTGLVQDDGQGIGDHAFVIGYQDFWLRL